MNFVMSMMPKAKFYYFSYFFALCLCSLILKCEANDILGCGGFVKSHANIDFSKIEIGLYTKQGSLKEKTECAPTNGYYFLPLYEKGEYILRVHPPTGWSFEPSEVALNVDGVTDSCTTGQDVNFAFNGFGITGKVVTFGQSRGPRGISVRLIDEKGVARDTTTKEGGDFQFTPVIPGKYTIKASHPKWKLEPSSTLVLVMEGNTEVATGALAVQGYDVRGTVLSGATPVPGVHILLYSVQENPKQRVEGCTTALLQGVPDSPICYSVTDASGTFTFGLVPAGDYYLLPLTRPPGQSKLSFNARPERVDVNVRHDSLFIKDAFQVTGYTVVGSVVTHPSGKGMEGVRVSMSARPVGVTDAAGKYTLVNLQPGTYKLNYDAEHCQFSESQLVITAEGAVSLGEAWPVRWRVCGAVAPAAAPAPAAPALDRPRTVAVRHDRDQHPPLNVVSDPSDGGKWCAFLHPGVYMASVIVSEQERRDGLQFFPLSQKISVSRSPVDGIVFSQLKATLRGAVKCREDGQKYCSELKVTLRPLSPDGSYVGQPTVTQSKGGVYEFSEVLPGSLEVSVGTERLCWASARHNVAVTAAEATVPDFQHTGYALTFTASHPTQVEYSSGAESGVLSVGAGVTQHCVASAGEYTFRPRGCRLYKPDVVRYNTAHESKPIALTAVSAAAGIRVVSRERVDDLVLRVDSMGLKEIGPITPTSTPEGTYVYEHTLYLAHGEFVVVSAWSNSLLLKPSTPQQLLGSDECRPAALEFEATRGLTLVGRLDPPVSHVTITLLSGGEEVMRRVTQADGEWRFGPLDASLQYEVRAERESYVFSAPGPDGVIRAHKLAEINVLVVDDADQRPLHGALVSVSGGEYRRNLATGADGRLTFPSLAPADYFIKPLMKEYRFTPAHKILQVAEGNTYQLTLKGMRVAWSGAGKLVSLGGVGLGGATVVAMPAAAAACPAEEAQTEQHTGAFRLRGLLPNCEYTLTLKPSTLPEHAGLKLANLPVTLKLSEVPQDLEGIRLTGVHPTRVTDVNVLVHASNVEHYRTLKLRLALDRAPHSPVYSTKLDAAGYSNTLNPGLMYVLPRLPADNKTYQLQLESTLSLATHTYSLPTHYFNSDGEFKHFTVHFTPKVKTSEQELSQTSLLVLPLLALVGAAVMQRARVLAALASAGDRLSDRILHAASARPAPQPNMHNLLDESQINQIVHNVNAVNKRAKSRKAQ